MSIILFFGACLIVVLVSTIYVAVAIRHLLKNKKGSSITTPTDSGAKQ